MLGPVELVDEVDSTNAELLRRARAGAAEGVVLVARHQSAGRGRLDRRWEAPPGSSLLVSVLLRPGLPPEDLHLLPVAAGLAAADACDAVAGVRPSLKWPNDLVVTVDGGSAKLAGLLAESVVDGGRIVAVVVGIGLNLNWTAAPPAGGVALAQLAGGPVDGAALLEVWLDRFDRRLGLLAAPGGARAIAAEHRAACSTIGSDVRVELAEGSFEGRALDVTDAGHLVVDTDAGRREVTVADVVHLRPAPAAG